MPADPHDASHDGMPDASDAEIFLSRMDGKIRVLKNLVGKQQVIIDSLRLENASLKEAHADLASVNEELSEAQKASSAEIARLCDAAASSAEAFAGIQQCPQCANAIAPSPKHVVVDTRRTPRTPRPSLPTRLDETSGHYRRTKGRHVGFCDDQSGNQDVLVTRHVGGQTNQRNELPPGSREGRAPAGQLPQARSPSLSTTDEVSSGKPTTDSDRTRDGLPSPAFAGSALRVQRSAAAALSGPEGQRSPSFRGGRRASRRAGVRDASVGELGELGRDDNSMSLDFVDLHESGTYDVSRKAPLENKENAATWSPTDSSCTASTWESGAAAKDKPDANSLNYLYDSSRKAAGFAWSMFKPKPSTPR